MIVNKELLAMLPAPNPLPDRALGIPIVQNDALPSNVAVFVQDGQPVASLTFADDRPSRTAGDWNG